MVAGMLMPMQDLRAIYEVLFRDGVMVAKKDKRPQIKHPEIQGVSNLQVIRAMGSLKSRGYVKETFAWRHFYWYLTNEGIVYLREYLHLPPEIVPVSLQRVRKPATTLAIAQQAARVQSVKGPTSYVPKPGQRGEAESQGELAERQGYRHKMMGPGERESYSDRTPRFRGRPLAAEPVKPKASWEGEDQPQPLFHKGRNFRGEAAMMEESRVKSVSRQHDMRSERPLTTSQERRGFEVQKEKVPSSVSVQRASLKHDVSQTMLRSVSSKAAVSLSMSEATGAATLKIPSEPVTLKTNKEESNVSNEKSSFKSREMSRSSPSTAVFTDTVIKEEKTTQLIVDPIKPEVEVKAALLTPQAIVTVAAAQETIGLSNDTVTGATVITKPVGEGVKEGKTAKLMHPVKSSLKIATAVETTTDQAKPQAVTTKLSAQKTSRVLTDTVTTTSVITKPANKDVREGKGQRVNVKVDSLKPTDIKAQIESKIDNDVTNKDVSITVSVTQETKSPPDSTTSKPALSTYLASEISKSKVTQAATNATLSSVKPETVEVLLKTTTPTEPSIFEVTSMISTTTLPASIANVVKEKAVVKEIITKQEKTDVKVISHIPKDEVIVLEEGPKIMAQDPKETKEVAEGSSKSKRKKKKSPSEAPMSVSASEALDVKVEMENNTQDNPPKEVTKMPPPPMPLSTSETVSNSVKTEETLSVDKHKHVDQINGEGAQVIEIIRQLDEKPKEEATKQTGAISAASPPVDQHPAVPPVVILDEQQPKEKVAESSGKITQGPVSIKGELNINLHHMEQVRSEEIRVKSVETVSLQKITQESSKPEKKYSASQSESNQPTVETDSPVSTEQAAEESSKGKKKGKGKKKAKTADKDTKLALLPEAEALISTDMTSLSKAKDSPVTASTLTEMNVSLKTTPERMCSKEVRQAAAVLSEAPADKGEEEPALLYAEKIKREVPKPKTSCTAREAPAAREIVSAATVEAAVAHTRPSPLVKQEEPPRVAQHLASQAVECSTEKRLSVSEALKQEEEKKRDLEEDTPSVSATPAAAKPDQPHLGDTCESVSPDIDEAAMRKKIVVVEEIVEVRQVLSPQAAGGQTPPPPVQPEQEEEELDLDVLEAIAIERALLLEATPTKVRGASPDIDWDHSLEAPEEKTWPHFIEG